MSCMLLCNDHDEIIAKDRQVTKLQIWTLYDVMAKVNTEYLFMLIYSTNYFDMFVIKVL